MLLGLALIGLRYFEAFPLIRGKSHSKPNESDVEEQGLLGIGSATLMRGKFSLPSAFPKLSGLDRRLEDP